MVLCAKDAIHVTSPKLPVARAVTKKTTDTVIARNIIDKIVLEFRLDKADLSFQVIL